MESRVSLTLRRYFSTFVAEEDQKIVDALNQGASAIYQLERIISLLEEAPAIQNGITNKTTTILEEILINTKEFLETIREPNNAPQQDARVPRADKPTTS